jgi:hypothetical protein
MRVVVLLLAVVLASCGRKKDAEGEPDGKPGSGVVEVEAQTLYHDYRDKVASADAKYLNKTLRIKGRFLDPVEQTKGGTYAVGFETGPHVIPSGAGSMVLKPAILCYCSTDQREKIGALKFYDEMVIVGNCQGRKSSSGRMGGIQIMIDDARLISHVPSSTAKK